MSSRPARRARLASTFPRKLTPDAAPAANINGAVEAEGSASSARDDVRIDGIKGISIVLGVSPKKVRMLARREKDPLIIEADVRGPFVMQSYLTSWAASQRCRYVDLPSRKAS